MGRAHISLALVVSMLGLVCFAAALYDQEKQLWVTPAPKSSQIGEKASWLDEYGFTIQTTRRSFTHDILKQAFKRHQGFLKQNKGVRISFSLHEVGRGAEKWRF